MALAADRRRPPPGWHAVRCAGRRPVPAGDLVTRRLRDRALRLVLEQQVLAAGRPALFRADGELRAADGPGASGGDPALQPRKRLPQPGAYRRLPGRWLLE